MGGEFKKGREAGLREGVQQGVQQGEVNLLRRQLSDRFGPLPGWASEKLSRLSALELEQLGVSVLHVKSLEELLG